MLPDRINLIFLSATTPNTEEFCNWIGRTKRRKVRQLDFSLLNFTWFDLIWPALLSLLSYLFFSVSILIFLTLTYSFISFYFRCTSQRLTSDLCLSRTTFITTRRCINSGEWTESLYWWKIYFEQLSLFYSSLISILLQFNPNLNLNLLSILCHNISLFRVAELPFEDAAFKAAVYQEKVSEREGVRHWGTEWKKGRGGVWVSIFFVFVPYFFGSVTDKMYNYTSDNVILHLTSNLFPLSHPNSCSLSLVLYCLVLSSFVLSRPA